MTSLSVQHTHGDRFTIGVRDHQVVVDQPMEAGGDDLGPTPTELFVASLAACVGFFAQRFLRRHGLPEGYLRVECDFTMTHDRPARVESIDLRLILPEGFPPADRREALLRALELCTVHNSIREAPTVRIELAQEERAA